ncbi:BTB/POZ domain-containing protein At2g30600 [Selaginella moellendorffii]|nr:BTB/POZ domain-containing protein At2g30600 [Selaginella moellendorffii]XP_024518362.1 BTB/POZ domain-containing protein At2g30600 [Selaginella moellendorffii]XP_024518367.1 BTB/POZ domain-containing protein At2g30600 [Selaginella moellendorffii]|eukprot:XP_024518354.1 BTB/POZ domain-containing protein At2g30600 [Selaginella moellendorffii]
MMKLVENNVLVVPPFDCAWLFEEELRFPEAGRGCVAFEARAENDVTVIFKELAGCKHYRTDSDPNYTVIIGSNLNKRLKIAANGRTVVDVAGPVVSPLVFERYWISVDEGSIVVGKGELGQNVVYQWVDPEPNCKVQFVGLSSWDKHVGYRNISVAALPPCLYRTTSAIDAQWSTGLANFLESGDLSDFEFVLFPENRRVCAHRAVLVTGSSSKECPFLTTTELELHGVDYLVLHAALRYVYTGKAEIGKEHLVQLRGLAELIGFQNLAAQCKQHIREVSYDSSGDLVLLTMHCYDTNSPVHVNPVAFTRMLSTGDLSDLEVYLEDYDRCLQLHRLVLSVWSAPFAKMFTIGMKESNRTRVTIKDVHLDAFMTTIRFMYTGRLDLEGKDNAGSLLLPLLIMADRYGVRVLHQECLDHLLACVNEDSSCAILQVASSMARCETLRQACEESCAKHFDYCVAASATEFTELDGQSVMRILQHPDLLVTSEEKVLDAVFMWGSKMEGVQCWEEADTKYKAGLQVICPDREEDLKVLLPLIRFPLMSMELLQQLDSSALCENLPLLRQMVGEACDYLKQESFVSDDEKDLIRSSNQGRFISLPKNGLWFTRRLSSFKELNYLCDGDGNGVLYYAGTSYGAHEWMNPMVTKQITLSASSPHSRYTDPKVLASRNYQATSFAGPCIERGETVSWWRVDLGPDHKLMCNYYSVRQDGSTNFARNWTFQGSGDGETWTDLRKHEKDHSIYRPAQYASWPVHGSKSLIPFRFFRVLLQQPIAAVAAPWNLSICYLELYGYLH